MSNDFPGDEPTKAHRPFEDEEPTAITPRRNYEDDATRLETSIPPYDPNRPPAGNPYPLVVEDNNKPGIVAQLVAVGLVCIFIGLGLGYFLFKGIDANSSTPETTTTTTSSTTTSSSTTTTEEPTTSTAERTTTTAPRTTTTVRPTTTTARPTTTTARPTTTAAPTTTTTAVEVP